jgi:hypothetical protein
MIDLFKRVSVRIEGLTPMIQHNGQIASPLNPYAKKLKEISSIRKKTDSHFEEMAEIEWRSGLYWDDEIGVYVPAENLFAMLIKGAKRLKLGPYISAVTIDTPIGCPLITKNAKDLVALNKDPANRLQNLVTINRSKVLRTRPKFDVWELEIPLEIDDTVITLDQVEQIIHLCGKMVGLSDWRPSSPQSPGIYGKFIVNKFEEIKNAKTA